MKQVSQADRRLYRAINVYHPRTIWDRFCRLIQYGRF